MSLKWNRIRPQDDCPDFWFCLKDEPQNLEIGERIEGQIKYFSYLSTMVNL